MRSQIEREQDDGDYAANGIRDRRGEDNQFRTVWVTRDYGDRIEEIHQRIVYCIERITEFAKEVAHALS